MPRAPLRWRSNVRDLRPMLATVATAPLDDRHLAYEPKYDGIRALVELQPAGGTPGVRIRSRLGNEKTSQFPEIVRAFERFARRLDSPAVIDGEIVALTEKGEPTGFQRLQGRIHLTGVGDEPPRGGVPVAFIAFDLLRSGDDDLCSLPLIDRRARLERLFKTTGSPLLRLSDFLVGNGKPLYDVAVARGWEGLIAKHVESTYRPGRRTADWRKIKLVRQQEFVIGGWTEPRGSRPYFGALLLGVYEETHQAPSTPQGPGTHQAPGTRHQALVYVGHTGSGFNDAELARVWKILTPLETRECPFAARPRTNERPHWVEPRLVAEVRFTEWTDDQRLRHPIYLGLRDDVPPQSVRREPVTGPRADVRRIAGVAPGGADPVRERATPRAHPQEEEEMPARRERSKRRSTESASLPSPNEVDALVAQIDEIQARGGDGRLRLSDGHHLDVTNLNKILWPALKLTKGDLLRYYARSARWLLPVVADRPLVMKRFPNGIHAKAFYQQRAPDNPPVGVRVESVAGDEEVPRRLVGGSETTLMYMAQMAAISQDPWFSRVQSPDAADHVALDLDPMPGIPFTQVLDVARWLHDELDALQVAAFPKTSGAAGLHIYVPLPPDTPYEAGLIFCQIIATMVARRHPKQATVERAVRARGRRVYIDYLQNIRGKTLASAYSARASEYAGVSTPLTWREVHDGVEREDFTIKTVPDRVKSVGDLWAGLRRSKGADLRAVQKYAEPQAGRPGR